jgi:hypothetical protein
MEFYNNIFFYADPDPQIKNKIKNLWTCRYRCPFERTKKLETGKRRWKVLYSFYPKKCEFFHLDLGLDILDGVRGLHLQGDGLPRQGLHKDLHGRLNTGVKPASETQPEIFNLIYYHIFDFGNVMENLAANVWIRYPVLLAGSENRKYRRSDNPTIFKGQAVTSYGKERSSSLS